MLVDIWFKDGEAHSQAVCAAGVPATKVTLIDSASITFAECRSCAGIDGIEGMRLLTTVTSLLSLLETDDPSFSDLVRFDALMWRDLKGRGVSDLLRDAFAKQAAHLAQARGTGCPLEMYGRFCAPVAPYVVSGRQARELVQWIERVSHDADLTAVWTDPRYAHLSEQLQRAIKESPKTWAVWSSPASIEERGALLRCLASDTRVLQGGAETVSCGYVPMLFVEGIQHSRRDVCAVFDRNTALTCMALYRMGPALKTLSGVAVAASCLTDTQSSFIPTLTPR